MEKIIANCSSIYNIDTANLLFALIDRPSNNGEILLNDQASISRNKNHRKYISRLSFPLFEWEKDSESNWKLLHEPLENIEFSEQIIFNIKNYCDKINNLIVQGSDSNYKSNLKTDVWESFIKDYKIETCTPLITYSKIILHIFSKIIRVNKSTIELMFSGEYYSGSLIEDKHIQVIQIIKNYLLFNTDSRKLMYCKGGKILVQRNGDWIEFDGAYLKNDVVYLTDSASKKEFGIDFNLIHLKKNNLKLRFTGPLEFLFFSQFGIIVDLPNYFTADYLNHNELNFEYISPISVSDLNRVSIRQGGNGFRLTPSGYSLLDYKSNNNVLYLIRGVFKCLKINWHDLEEFYFLINNYPRSSEKVSEDQRTIRKYISDIDKKLKVKFRSGSKINSNFINGTENLLPTNIGLYLLSITSFLNHLKEIKSPYSEILLDKQIEELLLKNKFMFNNGLSINVLLNGIDLFVSYTLEFLKNIGMTKDDINVLEIKYSNFKNNIFENDLDDLILDKKSKENQIKYASLFSLKDFLQELIYEYYSFMIFFFSSVLKANIYTSFFCLGKDGYYNSICNILEIRKERKYLFFKPIYFKEI